MSDWQNDHFVRGNEPIHINDVNEIVAWKNGLNNSQSPGMFLTRLKMCDSWTMVHPYKENTRGNPTKQLDTFETTCNHKYLEIPSWTFQQLAHCIVSRNFS